ncbi:uncharacterized protein N7482_007712 [Penicillium canariense]|uniref:Uncharacterized protein n=1 Tax=Penicillium canariense TaxID=189055 RepID=A0A9W9HZK2_9EURO|nr:uncharacterized protein N7482_007712 [Penicillium canariense]KAJ5160708.1 hypothetical protein N7482_007712 [Penicillium canariense]
MGLQKMIEAKGGIGELHDNWRLEHVVYLWVSDLRTFMGFSSRFYVRGLSTYPALYQAVLHLRDEFQHTHAMASPSSGMSPFDYERLICLFFICLMMQDSVSSTPTDPMHSSFRPSGLDTLDGALMESRGMRDFSVQNLRPFLNHHLVELHPDGMQKIEYVRRMTEVLGLLRPEARIGVEKCLLNMLCRSNEGHTAFLVDDGWTPDSLLSSMHGQ